MYAWAQSSCSELKIQDKSNPGHSQAKQSVCPREQQRLTGSVTCPSQRTIKTPCFRKICKKDWQLELFSPVYMYTVACMWPLTHSICAHSYTHIHNDERNKVLPETKIISTKNNKKFRILILKFLKIKLALMSRTCLNVTKAVTEKTNE